MYIFKGLGADPSTALVHEQLNVAAPIVNNPTVPAVNQPFNPTTLPVTPGTTPPGYVNLFGFTLSYMQIGLGIAAIVGGFFLWKHYKAAPSKAA